MGRWRRRRMRRRRGRRERDYLLFVFRRLLLFPLASPSFFLTTTGFTETHPHSTSYLKKLCTILPPRQRQDDPSSLVRECVRKEQLWLFPPL